MNRSFLCVALMLTVAPITATTVLSFNPDFTGGEPPSLLMILTMSIFGLITIPLWLTYIPALIIAPIFMKRVAATPVFQSLRLPQLIMASGVVGGIAGVLVMALPILMTLLDFQFKLALLWAFAGACSGALTLSLIALFYHWDARLSQ